MGGERGRYVGEGLLPVIPVGDQKLEQSRPLLQEDGSGKLGCGQSLELLTGVVIQHIASSRNLMPHCTFH